MSKASDQNGKDPALDPSLPQKKRARRRLVGALALTLAAAIALPLMLDHEPRRTVGSDVRVEIPSRDTPLPGGASGAQSPSPASPSGRAAEEPGSKPDEMSKEASAASAEPASGLAAGGPVAPAKPSRAGADASPAQRTPAKPDLPRPVREDDKRPALSKSSESTRPDMRSADAKPPSDKRRFALQAGAYATQASADQQVNRIKAAGLRAYTEPVKTPKGDRIRVRLGPFDTRERAEQARGQLKLSGIDAIISQ